MAGLFDDHYSNGIVVRKSAFGGYEVLYGTVRLQCNSPTPAAAALDAIRVISANRGEKPVDLIDKVEDPNLKKALKEYAASLVENAKAGIINKSVPAQAAQTPQQANSQWKPGQFQMGGQSGRAPAGGSLDKWSALEKLLNKNEDTYNNTRFGIQINQARQADQQISMISNLIAKIETMTDIEFQNSKLRSQLEAGDIQGAVKDHVQAVQNFRRNRGLGNLF